LLAWRPTQASLASPVLQFLEQFLLSPVRTEDPSQANLFFIPAMLFAYTSKGRVAAGSWGRFATCGQQAMCNKQYAQASGQRR